MQENVGRLSNTHNLMYLEKKHSTLPSQHSLHQHVVFSCLFIPVLFQSSQTQICAFTQNLRHLSFVRYGTVTGILENYLWLADTLKYFFQQPFSPQLTSTKQHAISGCHARKLSTVKSFNRYRKQQSQLGKIAGFYSKEFINTEFQGYLIVDTFFIKWCD